jgi:hypothetical protein
VAVADRTGNEGTDEEFPIYLSDEHWEENRRRYLDG